MENQWNHMKEGNIIWIYFIKMFVYFKLVRYQKYCEALSPLFQSIIVHVPLIKLHNGMIKFKKGF